MKKAEREKIIKDCVEEFETTDFPEIYPSGSWKEFMEDVRNLYGIIRRHFGRAESKRITIGYFAETDTTTDFGKTFYNQLCLGFATDALAEVK